MRSTILTGALAGALVLGGTGAAVLVPSLVSAADPSAAPTAAPAQTGTPPNDGSNPAAPDGPGGRGGPGGPGHTGGRIEAVSDASVVAKAIGITEADLQAAEASGQTWAQVAKAHNVDLAAVIDAIVADAKDELAAAVKAGTITQAQADAETANLTQFATDQVNGTGHGRGGPGGGMGRGDFSDDAAVVAKAIGISASDLTTALQGGKTIADVAKANNVPVQTVIDALVADKQAELAAAVKAGTMTQAQADTELANVTAFATGQVNGTGFGPGGHGPDGHGPDGRAPAGTAPTTTG